LRSFILNYFGERKHVHNCGTCSNCTPGETKFDKAGTLTLSSAATPTNSQTGAGKTGQIKTPSTAKPLPEPSYDERVLIDKAPTGAALRAKLRAESDKSKSFDEASKKKESRKFNRNLSDAETIVVKKILSCVARMRGRFGKGAVAAVLKGSKSKQIVENNLHQLSTYGILTELSQDDITIYIKALIEADCIAIGQSAYPTVSLTEFGREVMTGQQEVMLNLAE
jgi:superfamily II DNA helicase RecQ